MANVRPSNADMDRKFQEARMSAATQLRKVNDAAVKNVEDQRRAEGERIARFDSRLKR